MLFKAAMLPVWCVEVYCYLFGVCRCIWRSMS